MVNRETATSSTRRLCELRSPPPYYLPALAAPRSTTVSCGLILNSTDHEPISIAKPTAKSPPVLLVLPLLLHITVYHALRGRKQTIDGRPHEIHQQGEPESLLKRLFATLHVRHGTRVTVLNVPCDCWREYPGEGREGVSGGEDHAPEVRRHLGVGFRVLESRVRGSGFAVKITIDVRISVQDLGFKVVCVEHKFRLHLEVIRYKARIRKSRGPDRNRHQGHGAPNATRVSAGNQGCPRYHQTHRLKQFSCFCPGERPGINQPVCIWGLGFRACGVPVMKSSTRTERTIWRRWPQP